MKNRTILNIVLVILSFYGGGYTLEHHSDGGCDGGTCVVLFFLQTIPLLITSVMTILAINKCISGKLSFYIFLLFAVGFNVLILVQKFGSSHKELYYPSYILVGVHCFCVLAFLFYFRQKRVESILKS